jgi:hypothetical protein
MTENAERLEREAFEAAITEYMQRHFGMPAGLAAIKESDFRAGWQAARRVPAEAGAPEGWQLVPVALTQAMDEAMDSAMKLDSNQHLWDSAIAAAPASPKHEPHQHAWGFFTLDNTYRCRCGATTMEKPC